MFIYEFRYKLKPDADAEEMVHLVDELALPVFARSPGCISATLLKYKLHRTADPDAELEWDYVFVVVWESEEAATKALEGKYVGGAPDSQLTKTGIFEKFWPMTEKTFHINATTVISTKQA
jgi:quinol monooxygenase YgiN